MLYFTNLGTSLSFSGPGRKIYLIPYTKKTEKRDKSSRMCQATFCSRKVSQRRSHENRWAACLRPLAYCYGCPVRVPVFFLLEVRRTKCTRVVTVCHRNMYRVVTVRHRNIYQVVTICYKNMYRVVTVRHRNMYRVVTVCYKNMYQVVTVQSSYSTLQNVVHTTYRMPKSCND